MTASGVLSVLMPAFSYSTQLDPLTAHAHTRIETYPHKLFNTGGKKNHQSHDDEVFASHLHFSQVHFSQSWIRALSALLLGCCQVLLGDVYHATTTQPQLSKSEGWLYLSNSLVTICRQTQK